ncbi:MAG: hypothetical protein U5L08_14685 [Xanthomonadales bacterium]|nr:hypothetical protein [Xanthomonadales bacterium]
MICRGGENISPSEVEAALEKHPHVAQAVVLGLADDRLGESVAACVRFIPGAGGDFLTLEGWLRERIAPFKVPRNWRAVKEFPVTPTGKIQRHRLLPTFEES